jgi:hypothetical protein
VKKTVTPPKAGRLRTEKQPSPEAKKAGWERRRQAQAMMDKIKEYMSLSQEKFDNLLNDIKRNPQKYTVQDVMMYKYAMKAYNGEKFLLDWMDRNISKAPVINENKNDNNNINTDLSKEEKEAIKKIQDESN